MAKVVKDVILLKL